MVAIVNDKVTGDLSPFCNKTLTNDITEQGLYANPATTKEDANNCDQCPPTPANDCAVPNPLDSATWTGDINSVPVATENLLAGSEGRYFIVYYYYHRSKGSDATVDSYYFTITAKGVGPQGGEVVLRSYYGAKINMGQI